MGIDKNPEDQLLSQGERRALLFLAACFGLGCISLAARSLWQGQLPEPFVREDFSQRKVFKPGGPVAETKWVKAYLRVNVNKASGAELQRLPGIGPELSRRIVEDRRLRGPFTVVNDLSRVRGIGPKTLSRIHDLITVDGETPARLEGVQKNRTRKRE